MTNNTFTRKAVLSLTLLIAILGIAACGTTSTSVAEIPAIVEPAAPTEITENIESADEQVDENANLTIVDEEGNTDIDGDALESALSISAAQDVTENETEGLLFMREEEKLARDVYLTLYEQWNINIFQNIAASEQTHTDAIKTLLDQYGLDDPMATDERGIFTNPDLQALYDQLVALGSQSLEEALKVGAAVEEIDILDLEKYLAQTDNADIHLVYENLLKGSRNHLRSFVSNIQRQTGTTYQPQYLPEDVYQTIIDSAIESGGSDRGNGNGNG
jgi:hypothetical protein